MHTDGSVIRTGFRALWTSSPDPAVATSAAVDTINCITSDLLSSCSSCVCTLLCYWSPTDDLCTSCLDQPQLATLFLHHQQCPQGWVYSETSHTCFKAFNHEKAWTYAKSFCQNGGGLLAQPSSALKIQKVLEAINFQAVNGLFWIGGKRSNNGSFFFWTGDNSTVNSDDWAPGFPVVSG